MKYWQKRIINQNNIIYSKEVSDIDRQLIEMYKSVAVETKADLMALYSEIMDKLDKDTLTANDLYKFNRYYELINNLNKNLTKLGNKELVVYEDYLTDYYHQVRENLVKTAPQLFGANFNMAGNAKSVVNQIWCADGQHWSDRVWANKGLLQKRIEKGLTDCVVRGGKSVDLAVQLEKDFNVGINVADRLARTELANVQVQSSAKAYEDAGLEYYEVIANQADDEECGCHDGKIYRFDEMEVGVNCPPFHPNCRCDILPVINTK